jgi:hypothetical protein
MRNKHGRQLATHLIQKSNVMSKMTIGKTVRFTLGPGKLAKMSAETKAWLERKLFLTFCTQKAELRAAEECSRSRISGLLPALEATTRASQH